MCAAQQDDGYLDTYYIINGKDRIFSNLKDHHELYCFGHLAEGAVAYFEATGKDKLLKAAERSQIISGRILVRRKESARAIPDMRSRKWRWYVFMKRREMQAIWR